MLHLLRFNLKMTNQSRHILPLHLSGESDVSMGILFKNLSVNMTSLGQLEHEEAIEMFEDEPWARQLEPWARQLDLQWEK